MRYFVFVAFFCLSYKLPGQQVEITLFDFLAVENNYKLEFNKQNTLIDSLMYANRNNLSYAQETQLLLLQEKYDSLENDDKYKDILNSKIRIKKSSLDQYYQTYRQVIRSFQEYLSDHSIDIRETNGPAYPEWELIDQQYETSLRSFREFLNQMDRRVGFVLFQMQYNLRRKNLETKDVGDFLRQNEYFDYFGILKQGLTLSMDQSDWSLYKEYYQKLIDIEKEYTRERLEILNYK